MEALAAQLAAAEERAEAAETRVAQLEKEKQMGGMSAQKGYGKIR